MARCMHRLQPQLAGDQHVAIVQSQGGVGRGARLVHHHRRVEPAADLAAAGKMVGVGVGVDDVAQLQAVLADQAAVFVDPR